LNGVVNPSTAGSYKVSVSTTSDTVSVMSPSYTVTAASSVGSVTVNNASPTTAANGLDAYVVGLTTSGTGGLSAAVQSTVNIVFPAGTTFQLTTSPLTLGATTIAFCGELGSTLTVQCLLNGTHTVGAGTALTATLNGVVNPSTAGSYKVSVSTTSDTVSVMSPSYTVTAASSVTGVTVNNASPTTSATGLTTYVVGVTTSGTGGLSAAVQSTVNIVFPAGTTFKLTTSPLTLGATTIAFCGELGSTLTVQCLVNGTHTVGAGTALTATLNGVVNPSTAGSYKVSVSTSSDTVAVMSPSYTVTAVSAVGAAKLTIGSAVTSATNVTYTFSFKATTGLAGDTGSSVSMVFPAATGLASLTSSPLTDGATTVAFCSRMGVSSTVMCPLSGGKIVHAGDTLTATINGVGNPSTTKQYNVALSTTSDTKAKSIPYCIAAAGVPCITKFSPSSGQVGATVSITGVNLNHLTGPWPVEFNGTTAAVQSDSAKKIVVTVPAGATSGPITVNTTGGPAVSTRIFMVLP
jgi:hypothetical protein